MVVATFLLLLILLLLLLSSLVVLAVAGRRREAFLTPKPPRYELWHLEDDEYPCPNCKATRRYFRKLNVELVEDDLAARRDKIERHNIDAFPTLAVYQGERLFYLHAGGPTDMEEARKIQNRVEVLQMQLDTLTKPRTK